MEDFLVSIFQYGIGTACLIFMMYLVLTTLKELTTTINNLNMNLTQMNERLDKIEDTLNEG